MTAEPVSSEVAGRGRRRPPPVPVEVVSTAWLTPRLVSIRVRGHDLSRFADAPATSHIKVFLPADGQDAPVLPAIAPDGTREWPEGVARPVMRTYTPRGLDGDVLEIQFVVHGDGPASAWAAGARPGSRIAIGGPGGRVPLDFAGERWWIAGDESAIPAIGTLLERIPPSSEGVVHVEIAAPADRVELTAPSGVEVRWHVRESREWGAPLEAAAAGAAVDPAAQYWVACEATAVRRIRAALLAAGVARERLVTRGYWRAGEPDHSDHDYGED